jgi:hypothetical protein
MNAQDKYGHQSYAARVQYEERLELQQRRMAAEERRKHAINQALCGDDEVYDARYRGVAAVLACVFAIIAFAGLIIAIIAAVAHYN